MVAVAPGVGLWTAVVGDGATAAGGRGGAGAEYCHEMWAISRGEDQ